MKYKVKKVFFSNKENEEDVAAKIQSAADEVGSNAVLQAAYEIPVGNLYGEQTFLIFAVQE